MMKIWKFISFSKERIEEYVLASLWDYKLIPIILKQDIYRFLSFFSKNYEKYWKIYTLKRGEAGRKKTKILKFGSIKFFSRFPDYGMIREVYIKKDYSQLKYFLPEKGDIILDLGAGIGDYSILASLKIGDGLVIAVEADSETYEILKRNLEINRIKNVIAIKAFVSNKESKDKITIDKLVQKFRLRKVNLIKMDIEGEEYNALLGANKVLRKFKPKIIVEIHSEILREKIIKFLEKLKYEVVVEKIKPAYNFYLCYFK